VEQFLEISASKWPHRPAIDFDHRIITFSELRELAQRVAAGLQGASVGAGTNVGLLLPNTPHYIVCFFAVLMAGGTVVNFSPMASPLECERQVKDSGARVIVAMRSTPLYATVLGLAEHGDVDLLVVCSMEDFLPNAAAVEGVSSIEGHAGKAKLQSFAVLSETTRQLVAHPHSELDEEVAVLQYTGGTTGKAKGAMLTHSNLSFAVHVHDIWETQLSPDSIGKTLAVLPFTHVIGLAVVMLRSIAAGRELVIHTRFDPFRVLEDVSLKKITAFVGVPAMYEAIAKAAATRSWDLSSLRVCGCGGSPISAAALRTFKERTGAILLNGYALTESTCVGTWQLLSGEPPLRSAGVPLPGVDLQIVDVDTNEEVQSVGQVGEICFTGPHIMKGYWGAPDATRETFRGERFHTGDLGRIDSNGHISIVDRLKDVFFCGGFNVYPGHIEEAVLDHPLVAGAIALAIDDDDLGQLPKLFVTPKPDEAPLTIAELYTFLRSRLASYEMPVQIEIRNELPMTAAGKPCRKTLLAEEAERRAPGKKRAAADRA
jgi:long-chain acyl-CoA synthetase